ncbi:hypothetical protein GN956_G17337 [Arapaima gigas]
MTSQLQASRLGLCQRELEKAAEIAEKSQTRTVRQFEELSAIWSVFKCDFDWYPTVEDTSSSQCMAFPVQHPPPPIQ